MELKKTNQRIIELAKVYGPDSYTFKQQTNILQKGIVREFIKTRENVTQKGFEIGNVDVLDIRKLFKAVESGKIDRQALNQILATVSGKSIDANGDVVESRYTKGIQKVSEIRKATKKRLENQGEDPRDMTLEEIDQETEMYFDFSTNFQTSYNETMKELGESKMRNHRVMGQLWKPGKKSYDELMEIKKYMDTYSRDARKNALKLEEE